ncbi:hypothetical protein DKT68_27095 [Micromonospora acroterricola]|uniref:Uncharacterized protein n=1 Tax=Micromonospora acroterricola TaxID=2202421 RepID=A0A317CTJ0_9ACTN|nr:hypothetical protein [Micromonospora acroterricola]PWR05404.1 hypothetical protein DKT68_27095 [Micromonospora acroterricola]
MTDTDVRVSRQPFRLVRTAAVGAPVLLLLYGILRIIDGLDGERGSGWAWNVGHALFLIAFVLFAGLVVGLRQLLLANSRGAGSSTTPPGGLRVLLDVAMVAGLVGAGAFLWVILGDLFPRLADAAPLPEPVMVAGPLLFQLGLLTLLVRAAVARPRLVPVWGPPLALLGFLSIAVNLDLLPIGAALILSGLLPLGRRTE